MGAYSANQHPQGCFFIAPQGAGKGLFMSEEIQEAEQTEEPQGEAKSETNWKAEARKWESLAKKGKAAEEELAKLKEAQMSELEKANAKAEQAQAELAEMKAERDRMAAAREYAAKESVPLSLLEFCNTEDMDAFCKAYKAAQVEIHAAPSAYTRINRGEGKPNPRDAFIAFAEQQLGK